MRILAYHEINDSPADPIHGVSITAFRQQMKWLADNGYRVAKLGDQARDPRTVGIMFDDGYLDTFTNAWPVLKEHGFVATVFLITGRVGDAIQWKPGWEEAQLMNWEQIQKMAEHGIQFGSHSRTHPDLTELSQQKLEEELRLSRQTIESVLGSDVKLFSFPSSLLNEVTVRHVYASGYDHAFRFSPFYPGTRTGRCGALPGTGILSYDDLDQFQHKVRGSLSRWLGWYIRRTKALARRHPLPEC